MSFLKKYWLLIVIPILVILASLLAVRIVNAMDYHHNDNDFFTFWLAGHLVAHVGSPYDSAQWLAGYRQYNIGFIPNPAFLYPLPLALLLAPLGLLPVNAAYILWVTLTQVLIIVSLVLLLSLDDFARAKLFFIPLLAGIVLFRPTILTLTQGQVSGLFLFILVLIAFLWQRCHWFAGGLLLGFLALKPNLGLPIIGLLAVWLLLQKHWSSLFGCLISGISLLFAGLIVNPHWLLQYWHIGGTKLAGTFGGSPTVWGLAALVSHNDRTSTLVIGGLTALLILSFFFRHIIQFRTTLPPLSLLALVVTVTLLITPYTWTYDQLLLVLPITSVVLAMHRQAERFPLASMLFIAIDLFVLILFFFNVALQVEILNVAIPAGIFGLCLWYFHPRFLPFQSKEISMK